MTAATSEALRDLLAKCQIRNHDLMVMLQFRAHDVNAEGVIVETTMSSTGYIVGRRGADQCWIITARTALLSAIPENAEHTGDVKNPKLRIEKEGKFSMMNVGPMGRVWELCYTTGFAYPGDEIQRMTTSDAERHYVFLLGLVDDHPRDKPEARTGVYRGDHQDWLVPLHRPDYIDYIENTNPPRKMRASLRDTPLKVIGSQSAGDPAYDPRVLPDDVTVQTPVGYGTIVVSPSSGAVWGIIIINGVVADNSAGKTMMLPMSEINPHIDDIIRPID